MITKAQVKHIQSLDDKKYRHQNKQFIVEGEKMIAELLTSSFTIETLYALSSWLEKNSSRSKHINTIIVEDFELKKISSLKTPNQVLAMVRMPDYSMHSKTKLALVLDDLQDPGNLGSIIRIADWYKIDTIYCSHGCADAYNPKVIQASMGSIFRIRIIECNIEKLLEENLEIKSYACVLGGTDLHEIGKINSGYILIGNESKGLSQELIKLSNHQITIPRKGLAESLNAAVACGIICDNLL